jgi:hypothetical protein
MATIVIMFAAISETGSAQIASEYDWGGDALFFQVRNAKADLLRVLNATGPKGSEAVRVRNEFCGSVSEATKRSQHAKDLKPQTEDSSRIISLAADFERNFKELCMVEPPEPPPFRAHYDKFRDVTITEVDLNVEKENPWFSIAFIYSCPGQRDDCHPVHFSVYAGGYHIGSWAWIEHHDFIALADGDRVKLELDWHGDVEEVLDESGVNEFMTGTISLGDLAKLAYSDKVEVELGYKDLGKLLDREKLKAFLSKWDGPPQEKKGK